jgi:hypothetical protein
MWTGTQTQLKKNGTPRLTGCAIFLSSKTEITGGYCINISHPLLVAWSRTTSSQV